MMDIDEQYLELAEELETLRAENADLKLHKEYDQTLDQLIIERDRLLLENESLDDKLQEQLCTVGSLLEENAKLIAERDDNRLKAEKFDDYKSICKLKGFSDLFQLVYTYSDVKEHRDALLAEREQWMKQEPVAWKHTERDDVIHFKVKLLVEEAYEKYGASSSVQRSPVNKAERYSIPLYTKPHPLPAQQIPEGYKFENNKGHIVVTCPDYAQEIVYADEPLFELMSLLSASQPKGDM